MDNTGLAGVKSEMLEDVLSGKELNGHGRCECLCLSSVLLQYLKVGRSLCLFLRLVSKMYGL